MSTGEKGHEKTQAYDRIGKASPQALTLSKGAGKVASIAITPPFFDGLESKKGS